MGKEWLFEGAKHLAELAKSYKTGLVIIVRKDGTFQITDMESNESAVPGEGAPEHG